MRVLPVTNEGGNGLVGVFCVSRAVADCSDMC